jgi:hypothetical protein
MRNEDGFPSSESGTGEDPGLGSAARKVSEGLGELGRALSDGQQGIVEPVAEFIQERPIAAVGLAFGIGYILAGGLFSRTTGRLLALSWRLGGLTLAKSLISSLSDPGREI